MKLRYLPLALAACLPFQSQADTLGVKIGGGMWDHEPSGTLRYQGTDLDLNSDLFLEDDKEGYFYVRFEHPVPLVPNVRVMSTALQNTGSGTLTRNINFGGQTFSASTPITSEITLDHTDFTIYWELLDNIVSLDLGLNLKAVDGKAVVSDGTTTETSTFDGIIPMGYVGVAVSPWEGIEFAGELSSLSVADSSVTDMTVKFSYTTDYLLGVEAGYRKINMELDDVDQVFSNMDFEGPFAGVYLHF